MTWSALELRQDLHRAAEPSGEEEKTARILRRALGDLDPDLLLTDLGGHGLAAAFGEAGSGPTVALRADMDALPLEDDPALSYASEDSGAAHRCGHDGHMATLVGVGHALRDQVPERGRVVLLFQPAEETGAGAARVLADSRFEQIRPDRVFAIHNLPGFPLGSVVLRPGVFASSSRGMEARFRGRESHAAEPQLGASPIPAMAGLARTLAALPQHASALHEGAKVTVVGLQTQKASFGVSPGKGRVLATLRAHQQETMERLAERAESAARGLATVHDLSVEISWHEDFPAAENDPDLTRLVEETARGEGLDVIPRDFPFPWSEDFAHFLARHPGVLFGLGAGEDQPALHAEGYDFPDDLLEPGIQLLAAIARRALEEA